MVEIPTATVANRSDSGDIVEALKGRMINHALPLWSTEGWDSSSGGFIDRLLPDGRVDYLAPRRVFVQARQIYCFAKAAQIGWYPQGREIALKGLDHLLTKAKSPDGRPGFVHTLAHDGSVLDPLRDTYDHAFVLLALASVYALDRDAQVRAEIDALVAFLDARLRSPHGGFLEGWPASMPRRQNPQMHLFESMIAAFDATHDAAFQNRAGELFALFLANLYDKQKQVLGEYFEDDWSRIEPVSVEPGHQAEWVWLLKGFERITGCPTGRYRAELLGVARCAIATRRQAALSTWATLWAISNGIVGVFGRRPKWPKPGLRRPRRARRAPPTKRARPCRGSNGIISTIPSRAAGTINSIVTAGRWSRPSRRLRFIMCSVRSWKPSKCSAERSALTSRCSALVVGL